MSSVAAQANVETAMLRQCSVASGQEIEEEKEEGKAAGVGDGA